MIRRDFLRTLLATGIGAATGASGYGYLYERHTVRVTRAALSIPGLPPGLSGLRIGLLTDLHRSRWVSHEDAAAAVSQLLGEKPDMIVLGGDYVTWGDRQYVERSAEALAPLAAPHGVFAILGNHDDDRDMPAALSTRHIHVLRDARTQVTINGEAIALVGIRYWTRRSSDIAPLFRGAVGFPILLAHDPRRLTEAAALAVPLVLSGHTHGGQVVLPLVGGVAAQKYPVVAGPARRGGTTMFVSRGVGTVYVPVRINCPPEAALLTLEPAPPTVSRNSFERGTAPA
jgi:uncharacterized protein